jgi:hypothetical protein
MIVPLLLVALLVLWNRSAASITTARLLAAGLALGFACLIRPTYALVAAAAAVTIFVRIARYSSPGHALRDAFIFALFTALPMIAFLAIFTAAGHEAALSDTFAYLATVYTDLDRKTPAHVLLKMFLDTPQVLWVGALLSVFALAEDRTRWKLLWVATLFVLCVSIRLVESKTYRYQFWPALASAALLAGAGWSVMLTQMVRRTPRLARFGAPVIALCISVVVPLLTTRPIVAAYRDLLPNVRVEWSSSPAYELLNAGSAEQAEVSRYLHEHSEPSDQVLLWGPGAMVYYAAQRFAASRFFVSTAFLCVDEDGDPTHLKMATHCRRSQPQRLQQKFMREFLGDIESRRPLYIVAADGADSLEVWEGECYAPDFPELRSVLEREYRVETTIGRWAVHRRSDERNVTAAAR